MKKKEEIVDFDLSKLNLKELINAYYEIEEFINFLNNNKIKEKEE